MADINIKHLYTLLEDSLCERDVCVVTRQGGRNWVCEMAPWDSSCESVFQVNLSDKVEHTDEEGVFITGGSIRLSSKLDVWGLTGKIEAITESVVIADIELVWKVSTYDYEMCELDCDFITLWGCEDMNGLQTLIDIDRAVSTSDLTVEDKHKITRAILLEDKDNWEQSLFIGMLAGWTNYLTNTQE